MRTLALALVLVAITNRPLGAQGSGAYDDRSKIAVNGEAVVYVKPDRIVVHLGVETSDADLVAAKQKNNDVLKKAIAAVKECGILEKDLQTDHLSIEPRYVTEHGKEKFIGHFVRNMLAVTVNDTGKVEQLVTKVLQAGVNYIHGVEFETTEFKKYREQARELALIAAKEKAQKMAAVLGQSIGAPLQISETLSGSPWYYSSWYGWGYGRSQGMLQNTAQDMRGGTGEISDTIALGRLSIRAAVSVTFELKK